MEPPHKSAAGQPAAHGVRCETPAHSGSTSQAAADMAVMGSAARNSHAGHWHARRPAMALPRPLCLEQVWQTIFSKRAAVPQMELYPFLIISAVESVSTIFEVYLQLRLSAPSYNFELCSFFFQSPFCSSSASFSQKHKCKKL
jgi:hypothetical protein